MNFIVGLGNPSEEYEKTRHNIGREILMTFAKTFKFPNFEYDKKINALLSEGKIGKEKITLILPDTYMNKSGVALKKLITSAKKAQKMVVVHDDLDFGIGDMKIVFGKKSAGHKGVESVIRAVRTKDFVRVKIGITPVTPKGKLKRVSGEEKVVKHVLGKFSPKEQVIMKKVSKKAVKALETAIKDGYLMAMNYFN